MERVIEAVREAGALVQEVAGEGFEVEEKAGQGPVTRADRGADRLLRETLVEVEPAAWLSEETTDDPARLGAERVWVVDPLDGTKEFVRGLPEYVVAAALVERGEPVLGVVHNPATGAVFAAERGGGAFRDGEPIRVAEGRRLLASRSELDRGEFEPFRDEWDVEPVGSIQHKLALVAAGEGAVTLSRGPKWEWDVCAGALLVEEAGGEATDLYGEPFRFNREFPKVAGVLAGAPESRRRAADRVERVGGSDRMRELEDRNAIER